MSKGSNNYRRLNFAYYDKHFLPENRFRANLDLDIRKKLWSKETIAGMGLHLLTPKPNMNKFIDYWGWYAKKRGRGLEINIGTKRNLADYKITKGNVLFYSGGVESIIGDCSLYNTDIIEFDGTMDGMNATYEGPIEGLLAIIGAAMGYANTYFGIEDTPVSKKILDLYGLKTKAELENHITDPDSIEQTEEWLRRWNKYAAPASAQSIVNIWTKDELFRKVYDLGELPNLRSCDFAVKAVTWCGDCYKCMSCWLLEKILDIPVTHTVSFNNLLSFRNEFKEFCVTGHDPHVSLGLYLMLEEKYNIKIIDIIDQELNSHA